MGPPAAHARPRSQDPRASQLKATIIMRSVIAE